MTNAEEPIEIENRPSELDEATHRELSDLFHESSRNLLFAKTQQWRTVVYASTGFAAIGALGIWKPDDERLGQFLLGGVLFITITSILLLVMYQLWQIGETKRRDFISGKYSSFFADARNLRSPVVGDIHRYLVLFALILFVVLAAIVTLRIVLVAPN